MSRFDFRPQEMNRQIAEIGQLVVDIGKQKKITSDVKNILAEMSGMQNVVSSLDIVSMSMDNLVVRVANSADALTGIARRYESAEQKIHVQGKMTGENPVFVGGEKVRNRTADNIIDQGKINIPGFLGAFLNGAADKLANDTEEADILGIVESVGGNKEAGLLKETGSYLSDFKTFFGGDKKGLTGAGQLCSLTNSSVKTWSAFYDYCCEKYEGVSTGFFGNAVQKNVKRLGVAASAFGVASKLFLASEGLEKKQWQDIWADYIDCGKELVSMGQSVYALKHIGDVKSLLNDKSGIWSKAGIYGAIAEAGIEMGAQGFRSHKKYYADGKWDVDDTGATFVDIAMSGIGGISHKLTFGLDDFIYGGIDKLAGGKGDRSLSYVEQAAEGWKIIGKKLGKWLGNMIIGRR